MTARENTAAISLLPGRPEPASLAAYRRPRVREPQSRLPGRPCAASRLSPQPAPGRRRWDWRTPRCLPNCAATPGHLRLPPPTAATTGVPRGTTLTSVLAMYPAGPGWVLRCSDH